MAYLRPTALSFWDLIITLQGDRPVEDQPPRRRFKVDAEIAQALELEAQIGRASCRERV